MISALIKRLTTASAFFAMAVFSTTAFGQIPITSPNQSFSFDFDGYAGLGLQPGGGGGNLDSNLLGFRFVDTNLSITNSMFGGTETGGEFGRGSSPTTVADAGIYAAQINGGTALGFQLHEQDAGRVYQFINPFVQLVNQTNQTIDRIRVDFDLFYLNQSDQGASVAAELIQGSGLRFAEVGFADFPAGLPVSGDWEEQSFSFDVELPLATTVPGFQDLQPLAPGDSIFVQLAIESASTNTGTDQNPNFVFDNIAINNIRVSVTSVPEPSSLLGLAITGAGLATLRRRRRD